MPDSYGTPSKYTDMSPRVLDDTEQRYLNDGMREFSQLAQYRNMGFAGQWEESAALILPTSRNTFFYGSYNAPGAKLTEMQIDSTGMMALHRFGAICDSLLTPRNMLWHSLGNDSDYVMKDRATRQWFEIATRTLFSERYQPSANFSSQNQANWQGLGAFGNGAMFVDQLWGPRRGLRYRGCPLGELFWGENHQGIVDRVYRWFKLSAWQAEEKWPGRLPANMRSALEGKSAAMFDFIHCVKPADDYDPYALDSRRFPFVSFYICITGKCLMWDEAHGEQMTQGYKSFPYSPMRYEQAPNEMYGRGPAQMVLPALKTLNAQKRTFLKQAHRAADPVLLTADNGALGFSMRPGALNPGTMTLEGKRLVDTLPTGNIDINEKMMGIEQSLIQDAFLVSLFQILTETPQMTATEVIERAHEKGILIAPVLGRQEGEYLGPMIDRELDILVTQRKLPPMPPRLREVKGDYKVNFSSPLSKAQHAQEVSGFLRVVSEMREIVAITGNPEPLDRANFDNFLEDALQIAGTRTRWLNTDEQLKAIRQNRAQSQQQQQDIESLPGKAAIMNAQTKIAKQGGQFPQQQPQGPTQ